MAGRGAIIFKSWDAGGLPGSLSVDRESDPWINVGREWKFCDLGRSTSQSHLSLHLEGACSDDSCPFRPALSV